MPLTLQDHRINLRLPDLEQILGGAGLDQLFDPLQLYAREQRVAALLDDPDAK